MHQILQDITAAGTSIWLDDLSRERLIANGKSRNLKLLIENESVLGVTTNPAIFSAAISQSDLYSADILKYSTSGLDAEAIINELTTADVSAACDLFMPVYERTSGVDGRVSIEVDPRLARDTEGTIQQARELWTRVNRNNVLIKVPATVEGIPAIRTLISEGISVNVTIIFSVERYQAVLEAFLAGLEDRLAKSLPISGIHSVASFFVSRVDTDIDPKLKNHADPAAQSLLGKAAIANARLAYEHFLAVINSPRWQKLSERGAAIQRPLWASTGVKDPAYHPTLYVMELIAPNTVNTMPEPTLQAVRDSGQFKGDTVTPYFSEAARVIEELQNFGIHIDEVATRLENEGIEKFIKPWLELTAAVERAAKQ